MAASQVLDKIRQELIDSGRDNRYRLTAYDFVLNGLEFYLTKLGEKRHVTGQEFSKALLLFAIKQFGPLTLKVLKSWGVNTTDDFGYIVYNLIDIGIMGRRPEDRLEDFFGVISFESFINEHDCFTIDPEFIKSIKGA